MKLFTLFLVFIYLSTNVFAQNKPTASNWNCLEDNFPNYDGWGYINLYIDTASNPNSIWQIGKPNKPIFNSTQSIPNAIVTDTLNAYPINDTSSFIIEQQLVWFDYQTPYIYFGMLGWYNVNSDSLNDFGKIEISMKGSNVWYDVLEDTLFDFFNQSMFGPKPTLTGNSNGWQQFGIDFKKFGDTMSLQTNDTMIIKFSFISDSAQTNKDGLMYDCFLFRDYFESVADELNIKLHTDVSPNPASDMVSIKPSSTKQFKKITVDVYDLSGRRIERKLFTEVNEFSFSVKNLLSGMYILKITYDDNQYSRDKLFIER